MARTRTLTVDHRLPGKHFNEAYDVTDDRDRDVLYVYRSTGAGFVFARMVGRYVQVSMFATAQDAFVAGMASLRRVAAYAEAPVVEQREAHAAADA